MAIEINVPPLGESITEATVGPWKKQAGDVVAMDELLCELETDKVTVEINAPAAGRLVEIIAPTEAVVELGAKLAVIDETDTAGASAGAAEAAAPAPVQASAPVQAAAPTVAPAAVPVAAVSADLSPAVRKLVAEHNLDPARIVGTGKDGRILKGDVLQAIDAGSAVKGASSAPASLAGASAATGQVATSHEGREKRVKMTRLRQRVAERLKDAQNTAAMLTTFNEVDMTEMMAARTHYRDLFEQKHGVRLGFMSFFVKACVVALKEIPAVNAEIQGDELVYKNYYDIGVAVGTPRGLVVPVLRDADTRGFADVEKGITDLGLRARDGKLTMDDLNGGTFTISNGGVYGSLMSTPILNPPQSGILGMHKIQDRPVAIDGKVEIRPMMFLALSYDHRIIDGREAVTFLVRVKECLEDPQRILLDL